MKSLQPTFYTILHVFHLLHRHAKRIRVLLDENTAASQPSCLSTRNVWTRISSTRWPSRWENWPMATNRTKTLLWRVALTARSSPWLASSPESYSSPLWPQSSSWAKTIPTRRDVSLATGPSCRCWLCCVGQGRRRCRRKRRALCGPWRERIPRKERRWPPRSACHFSSSFCKWVSNVPMLGMVLSL